MVGPPVSGYAALAMATWWANLYDDLLADMLLARSNSQESERTADFLVEKLGIMPGMRVLDQCCGIGSLSIPLASRGYEVVGVDQCEAYIDRGRRAAEAARARVEFHAADALEFVPERPVDGAFNWWTSFGYLPHDEGNARMLRRALEALRPRGLFLLDFMNVPGVLRSLQKDVVLRRATPRGEVVLHRESSVNLARGTLEKRWTYFLPDGQRRSWPSSVRLYMPHEVARLLGEVGFSDIEMYGDEQGNTLLLDSPRLILRARRPA
jgi:2-polyprenyl-3-methyl-5-hydroxy-6-metoxy-1,4-benzoquinol methylase